MNIKYKYVTFKANNVYFFRKASKKQIAEQQNCNLHIAV